MTGPSYIVERWPHGWLICSPPHQDGIPIDALNECSDVLPKGALVDFDLGSKMNEQGKRVVFCIGTKEGLRQWRKELLGPTP